MKLPLDYLSQEGGQLLRQHVGHLGGLADGVQGAQHTDSIYLCVVLKVCLVELQPELLGSKVSGLYWRGELSWLLRCDLSSCYW